MNEEEREARKSLFLKIGVFSVFALVFVLWLFNLQGVFSNNESDDGFSFSEISEEVEKNVKADEARLGLDKPSQAAQDKFVDNLLDKTEQVATSSATSSAVLEIKKELLDLTKNISSSTAEAIKNNCPPYINCMPTIGEARPCVIPAGCENITQIAY